MDQQTLKALFWDKPGTTAEEAESMLQNKGSQEYFWLLGRIVERLSPEQIFSLVDKQELYAEFPKLRVWKKLSTSKAQTLFPKKYQPSI